jgi:hypothetical protein
MLSGMIDRRRFAPASERNREPILEVLRRVVPADARVLEVASGSGEHAVHLAQPLGVRSWQPTDPDPEARASVDAWRAAVGERASRVLPALDLDVHREPWPVPAADVVLCINMIHIAPWSACEALFRGAAGVLSSGGQVVLYGPFRRGGAHTAPSNEAFDQSLRARDPAWGVRALEAVADVAARHGFALGEVIAMPANNFSVVFRALQPVRWGRDEREVGGHSESHSRGTQCSCSAIHPFLQRNLPHTGARWLCPPQSETHSFSVTMAA